MTKYKGVIIAFVCIGLLTGCWDKVELSDRSFIITIGLDQAGNLLNITYNSPNLPVVTGQSESGPKLFTRTTKAKTLYEANKLYGEKSNLKINFEHTKLIIFGKEFLEDEYNLRKVLDYFNRNSQFSKTVLALATNGKAEEFLKLVPNADPPIGMYISQAFENNNTDPVISNKVNIGELTIMLSGSEGNGYIGGIGTQEDNIITDGFAVIKNYSLAGWLDHKYALPFSWLTGKGRGTVLSTDIEGNSIPYEISEINTSMDFSMKDDNLKIKIEIQTEGDVQEYILGIEEKSYKSTYIKKVELALQKQMEWECRQAVEVIQKKFGFDMIGAGDRLKLKDRGIWMKVKDNWKEFFKTATIEIKCQNNIRRIGLAK